MKTTLAIIAQAVKEHKNYCLTFSGGTDSTILMDIVTRYAGLKPPVITVINDMEYPETEAHIKAVCDAYGLESFIARPERSYREQWQKQGWPFMGKLGARNWSAKNAGIYGYKLDVSSCCQNQKINPGRKITKQLRCSMQFTGLRGGEEDLLRGIRAQKDGAYYKNKQTGLYICNPLTGWTDTMCRRYVQAHKLPQHPARLRGAKAIGCIICGGGSNYEDSMIRRTRENEPDMWRRYIVDDQAGLVILSLKHKIPLALTTEIVAEMGGLQHLADHRPWIFDYTTKAPLVHSSK